MAQYGSHALQNAPLNENNSMIVFFTKGGGGAKITTLCDIIYRGPIFLKTRFFSDSAVSYWPMRVSIM